MDTKDQKSYRRATLSKIPWKSFMANLAVVGGAHALGYMASGVTSNALARTPIIQDQWHKLSPGQQRAVATGIIGATGSAIPLSVMATQFATQANLREGVEKNDRHRGTKTASVIMTYRKALKL